MRKILTALLCYILLCQSSFALGLGKSKKNSFSLGATSEFVFQSYPGQSLISIKLLGAVKKAGLYHIPKNMDVVTLLSLAGGTTTDANLEEVIIGQKSTKLAPKESLVVNIEKELEKGQTNPYTLKSEDVILVKRKKNMISSDTWRFISIISVALTSVLTVLAIDDRL